MNIIHVLAQGFYGNQTGTEVDLDNMQELLHGTGEPDDIAVVRIPGADNIALVYSKSMAKYDYVCLAEFIQTLKDRERFHRFNPTVVIPDLGLALFSTCFLCRIDEVGNLSSFVFKEDYDRIKNYLAV